MFDSHQYMFNQLFRFLLRAFDGSHFPYTNIHFDLYQNI